MKNLLIWWIDDETDRLDDATQRAIKRPSLAELKGYQATLRLERVKHEQEITNLVSEVAKKVQNGEQLPSLVVVDQRLQVQSEGGATQRGSSVAVALRAQAPEVPLVGVSGASVNDFPSLQREQFVEFFARDSISSSDRIPDLYAIAEGFQAVRKLWRTAAFKPPDIGQLLGLLKAPEDDAELLSSCLPGNFKDVWDAETAHSLSRWIWHVLLGMPGFTYDDLESATLLGLAREGFDKIANRFVDCTYQGAFASLSRRRWWLSRLRVKARKLAGAPNSKPIWEIGREILGVRGKALFSKCYGRTEHDCVPDVVAFRDERYDFSRRVQALASDTSTLAAAAPTGFETRRVLRRK